MLNPQGNDDEENVPPDQWELIEQVVNDVVTTLVTAFGLQFLMSGVLRWFFDLNDFPLAESFITDHPNLVIGITCLVVAMALCIARGTDAPRTGVNGRGEDGGTAEVLDDFVEASHDRVLDGSDGDPEQRIVQPPIQTLPVVTIPSSSSSRSGGGVLAGSGVVTAGDVEMGEASHRRRGEREIDAHLSGEAVRDIGKE